MAAMRLWLILCWCFRLVVTQKLLAVRKCCPFDAVLDLEEVSCVRSMNHQADLNLLNLVVKTEPNGTEQPRLVALLDLILDSDSLQCPDDFQYLARHESNQSKDVAFQLVLQPREDDDNDTSVVDYLSLQPFDDSMLYDDFCLDRSLQDAETIALYCSMTRLSCQKQPCFQTCCPWTHSWSREDGMCVLRPDIGDELMQGIKLFDPISDTPVQPQLYVKDGRMLHTNLDCDVHTYRKDSFRLYSDGSLFAGGGYYNYTQYCIQDRLWLNNLTGELEQHVEVLVCVPEDAPPQGYLLWKFTFDLMVVPGLMILSSVCLIILFVKFWMTKRSRMFGAIMLSTVATLTVSYILLAIAKLSRRYFVTHSPRTCMALGFMIQLSYMSSFFWLTCMSMDIWLSFRSLEIATQRLKSTSKVKYGCLEPRYKWYALTAWGLPLLVTAITITIQLSVTQPTAGLVLPDVGKTRCFFGTELASLLYLFALTAPALLTNLLLFIGFVYNFLWGVWARPKSTTAKSIHRKHQSRALIVIKMFFVMGIIFGTDLISWGLYWGLGRHTLYKFTAFIDVLNSLQGCLMLIIFSKRSCQNLGTKFGTVRDRFSRFGRSDGHLASTNTERISSPQGTQRLEQ